MLTVRMKEAVAKLDLFCAIHDQPLFGKQEKNGVVYIRPCSECTGKSFKDGLLMSKELNGK